MANDKKLAITITGDASKARKALAQLDGSLAKTESVSKRMGSNIKTALAGYGLSRLVFGSLQDADESLKVAHQTEAVIKSTGGAAKVTADEVGDLATAISNKTGMDDEGIQTGENMLLTFKNIRNEAGKGNDIFNQATHIMADYAAATGTDAKAAALQLGKALQDPTGRMSALAKVGITFTEQQKAQVKALQESGNMMGAQKIILKELTSEFGGSAEAQASSLDKIRTQAGNASEALGTALMPALDVASGGVEKLTGLFQELPQPVQASTVIVGGALIAWSRWGDKLKEIATNGAWTRLRAGLAGASEGATGFAGKFGGLLRIVKSSPAIWVGAAAAVGVLIMKWKEAQEAEARVAHNAALLQGAIRGTGVALDDAFDQRLVNTLFGYDDAFDLGKDNAGAFRWSVDKAGISVRELSKGLTGTDRDFERLNGRLIKGTGFSAIGIAATEALKEMRKSFKDAGMNAKEADKAIKALGLSEDGTAESTDDATQAAKDQAKALKDNMTAAAKLANDTVKELTDSITEYADSTTALLDGNINIEAGLDDLTEALKENGNQWDYTDEKGRANYKSLEDVQKAIYAQAQAMVKSGQPLDAVKEKWIGYVEQLKNTMRQSGLTEGQIKFLITQMGLTPHDIETVFHDNSEEAIQGAWAVAAAINSVPRDVWIGIKLVGATAGMVAAAVAQQQQQIQNAMNAAGGWGPPVHAIGGRLNPGWNVINERGPELVNSDGRVITAERTRQIMSGSARPGGSMSGPVASSRGGDITVVVQGHVYGVDDLIGTVREGFLEAQRRSSTPILPGVS